MILKNFTHRNLVAIFNCGLLLIVLLPWGGSSDLSDASDEQIRDALSR